MPLDQSSIQAEFTGEESGHLADCMDDEVVGLMIPPNRTIQDNLRQIAECKKMWTFGADRGCVIFQE